MVMPIEARSIELPADAPRPQDVRKKEFSSLVIIPLSGEISIANCSREKIAAERRHVNAVAFAFER
jgi:hypothetical protein